jgi:hypothetical protein
MTQRQYLLSQAEYCRRTAAESASVLAAEQLRDMAKQLERDARRPAGEPALAVA